MKNKTDRILYYDILNILACICVVAMHCNGIVHTYENTMQWKTALIVEVIAYWAVPVFFMLSGAKLLTYRNRYDTRTFLKKRVTRIVIPWISWCFIWLFYKVVVVKTIGIASVYQLLKTLYNGIFFNELQSTYWFFIPMIMVYFSMPVLSMLINNRKILWYFAGMTFLTYSFLPEICRMIDIPYNSSLYFPMASGYILFVTLGYLLDTKEMSSKMRYILYVMAGASAALRYVGTYCRSIKSGTLDMTYWGYLYFPSVLLAIGVFLFFKNQKYLVLKKSDKAINITKYLAGCSFGIYLMHFLIIDIVVRVFDIDRYSYGWRTFGVIIIYLLSLLCVSVIKKIPVLSKVLVP